MLSNAIRNYGAYLQPMEIIQVDFCYISLEEENIRLNP